MEEQQLPSTDENDADIADLATALRLSMSENSDQSALQVQNPDQPTDT